MVGLRDIGPLTKTIRVNGKDVEVGGISGTAFLTLLERFPEFRKVMSGGMVDFDPTVLLQQVPGAVGAVIAHVTGTPGDLDVEKIALALPAGIQVEIITAAWGLTFPNGVRAFLDALEGLARQVAPDVTGWDQATISPGQSSN